MSLACATDKHCKVCGGLFHPRTSMASICGPVCATRFARGLEKDRKVKAKAERAQTRKQKEEDKSVYDLIAEADKAFAAYIRARDRIAGYACISSGKPLDWASGNKVDAGHYRSRGAASHLRYHEDNCHAQTKFENRHRAGNAVEYRIGLIARIGLERVEALECSNGVNKWTKDDLRAIRATYKSKLKELEKEKANE